MSETELYFETGDAFVKFSEELEDLFPSTCSDRFGNTCTLIISRVAMLTTAVDKREIDEDEAKRQAEHTAVAMNCTKGVAEPRGPVPGICGLMALNLSV